MRGTVRPISLARKLVIDLMHASVPLVVVRRTMKLERLVAARALKAARPGWSAIIAKAFCIVARDEPWLRTFYLKWPWPHFYEVPKSVAMVAIVRNDIDKDAIVILKIGAADELSLADVEVCIRRGKSAALDDVPSIERALRVTRWPLPLRRLVWAVGLNIGRQRANYFGTFGIPRSPRGARKTLLRMRPVLTLSATGSYVRITPWNCCFIGTIASATAF